ncbi:MAG TPA: hypothetical protein PLR51_04330, partial [Methanomassiliicoccales archaeon]|nr:hypothetical protein [Methanomassiliicoccales archaeon]
IISESSSSLVLGKPFLFSIMSDGGKDCTAVPSRVITNASVKDILDEEAKVDLGSMAARSAEKAKRV